MRSRTLLVVSDGEIQDSLSEELWVFVAILAAVAAQVLDSQTSRVRSLRIKSYVRDNEASKIAWPFPFLPSLRASRS